MCLYYRLVNRDMKESQGGLGWVPLLCTSFAQIILNIFECVDGFVSLHRHTTNSKEKKLLLTVEGLSQGKCFTYSRCI